MLRSKSRSGFTELGKKSYKSALSRTISASRFCRGDPLVSQIDATALKPLDRNNSHDANSSEVVNQLKEELKMTKALLEMAEQEKDRALDELQEIKMEIELSKQINNLLAEKDILIDGLEVELSIFKASTSVITESLSESKRRIKELENEIEILRIRENNNDKLEHLGKDLALEEKEKDKREMEDLAIALREARTETNNANKNLELKEAEIEKIKQEGKENIKLLNEAKRENEQFMNTIERLRLEADESHLAWNEREIGFVDCVKEAEEERKCIQQEKICLIESLKSADITIDMFREENLQLKAVLKQKTGIANIENNLPLNSTPVVKDEGLDYQKLRVKELNRPLIVASIKDPNTEDKKQGVKTKSMKTLFDEARKGKIHKNRLSFDLSELKTTNFNKDLTEKNADEVPINADMLTGSVLDIAETPKLLTRRGSFSIWDGKMGVGSEDLNRLKESDIDSVETRWIWKRRDFLQTFEDLIKRTSMAKEDKSIE